jgi:tetratricopeptide (TPR) repeat protein
MLLQIGSLYFDLKQPTQSITSYQKALEIYRAIGDRANIGETLSNLGLIYTLSNQSNQAFSSFQAALIFAREVGNRSQESKLLGNLGLLIQKQYPELAIAFYGTGQLRGEK